jgi:hypothetical protein
VTRQGTRLPSPSLIVGEIACLRQLSCLPTPKTRTIEFAMSNDGSNFWSDIIPKFSLLGMVLAVSSMAALLCFAGYALLFEVRMSSHYDFLVSLYKLIGLTIASGFLFGVAGLWQRSPTRWMTPVVSILLAVVWLIGGVAIDPI